MAFAGLFWLVIAVWVLYLAFVNRRGRKSRREEPEYRDRESSSILWPSAETTVLDTDQDPVCGAYVVEKFACQRKFDGSVQHFCSDECAKVFEERQKKVV